MLTKQQPGNNFEHIKLQNNLRDTIADLEKKLEHAINERNITLTKYDENEQNWKAK